MEENDKKKPVTETWGFSGGESATEMGNCPQNEAKQEPRGSRLDGKVYAALFFSLSLKVLSVGHPAVTGFETCATSESQQL